MRDHTVENVDLLVIGGGKAGKSLEMDLAKAGWKVAMVERDKIGGTCINVACITTKALVGSARTMLMTRNADVMGVELGEEPLVSCGASTPSWRHSRRAAAPRSSGRAGCCRG
jgi:pyruvate/2-oxoglutarate dehydrogenase complex dihydrolipoamide dehydrogenase (E3) component